MVFTDGDKKQLFTIKGNPGDSLYTIIGQVLMSQNQPFFFKDSGPILTEPMVIHRISMAQMEKLFQKNFHLHWKKKGSITTIKSGLYWTNYSIHLLNYQYKMDSKINGQDNKTVNNLYHLSHEIVSNHNLWEELENNIKAITNKYFINKTTGIIAVYTDTENHKIMAHLFESIEKRNEFFFIITIKFWVVKLNDNHHNKPILINNQLFNQIQNAIGPSAKESFNVFYENQKLTVESVYEHKLSTLNNTPVIFNNQMEIIKTYQEKQKEYFKNRITSKNVHITEKFYEGMTLYVHPLLLKKKILIYFLPIIIDKLGDNLFYNKSLSSTFFVEDNKTFILGGFTRQYKYINGENLSFFNKIPLINWFFNKQNTKNIKEQMIITIHININKYKD
jgi:hypothetical protein